MKGHCEDVSLDAPVPFKLRLVVKGDKAKKSGDKARRLDTSPTLLNESPRQGLLVENIALNRNGIGSKSIDFTETRSTRSTLKSAVGVTLETPEIVHALDQTNIMSKSVFGFIPGRRVQISDSIGQWWPARMVSLEKGRILCRYDGWGEEHDEWIDSESRSMRDMQESDVTESMAILTETVSSQSYRSSKATLDSERPPPKKKKRLFFPINWE